MLIPDLQTIIECALLVIFVVAAFAASQWRHWYLLYCCVSAGGPLDEAPVVRLHSNLLSLYYGVHGASICCCGQRMEDDNEKKWEMLRNI